MQQQPLGARQVAQAVGVRQVAGRGGAPVAHYWLPVDCGLMYQIQDLLV